ncbi:MAG TPA: sialidase family protein [Acidimicrobiales bacterium]|jgi:Neuraminidase (sialidase)|nr:sialidase family protein [Acidimicrobiales bacterium]
MYRNARRLAVVAAGLVVLASTGAGAATAPRLTTPVQVTKDDLNPGRTYSSPDFVVDPANPLVIVGSYVELRTRRCGVIRTTDGGQTWSRPDLASASPSPQSYPNCNSSARGTFEAQPAFGRSGALYMALTGWDTQDGGLGSNPSVIVSKSTDLGNSWVPVVARNNRGKTDQALEADRPVTGIAVDAKSGSADIVYVGASRRSPGFAAPNAAPNQPIVMVSTDGGKTFGEPIDVSQAAFSDAGLRQKAFSATTTVPAAPGVTTTTAPAGSRAAQPDQAVNFGGFGPSMTVDNKGTVYAIWPSASANVTPSPPGGLIMSKSTDHGKTWTSSQIAPFDYKTGSFVTATWGPGGGADGTLHVVATGTEDPSIANYGDVYYYNSTDGGKTWSPRKNVTDDDPKQLYIQTFPNVAVAPNGRIDIAWFDTRNDPGTRSNDVYMTSSTDNGKTWSKNIRVTDQLIDRKIGVFGNNADVNAPPGLVATNSLSVLGWDDTRNGDAVGQAQDIYTASLQYQKIGGGTSKAAKVALAAVGGLLVVGLALLVAALATRGRRSDAAEAGSVKAKDKSRV